jgi:hypothetical protein
LSTPWAPRNPAVNSAQLILFLFIFFLQLNLGILKFEFFILHSSFEYFDRDFSKELETSETETEGIGIGFLSIIKHQTTNND